LLVDSENKGTTPLTNSEIDNILVIDDIENPETFSASRFILKEVNKYCPLVKVEFAYSLSKGGVPIHTSTKEDRDHLLHQLPPESFGRGVKHLPKVRSSESCAFIKGVSTSVSLLRIRQVVESRGARIVDIRRICNRQTGRPTRWLGLKAQTFTHCLIRL